MGKTRSGEYESSNIGKMGVIEGLAGGDFALPDGSRFNIKNDGSQAVVLSVQLACMSDGEFVETTFQCGWNPEIVKVVKKTTQAVNLKWGY
jgi:hypothetical protein